MKKYSFGINYHYYITAIQWQIIEVPLWLSKFSTLYISEQNKNSSYCEVFLVGCVGEREYNKLLKNYMKFLIV